MNEFPDNILDSTNRPISSSCELFIFQVGVFFSTPRNRPALLRHERRADSMVVGKVQLIQTRMQRLSELASNVKKSMLTKAVQPMVFD